MADRLRPPLDAPGLDVPAQPLTRGLTSVLDAAYDQHYRDVYRYVLALTGSHDDAEDVTAETFERAIRAWGTATSVPERPLAWLLLTARRIATDRWRRARRWIGGLLEPSGGRHELERTEFWLWFEALAEVLTVRQREVLVLRYQRDLSDDDIAVVMGLTRSGVRSLTARALDALRAHPDLTR